MDMEGKKNILRGMIVDFDGMYSTREEMKAYTDAMKSFVYHSTKTAEEELELMNFYDYCLSLLLEE